MLARPGRPSFHIKANCIAFQRHDQVVIYPLDEQGNIKKDSNGNIMNNFLNVPAFFTSQQPNSVTKSKTKKTPKSKTSKQVPTIIDSQPQAPTIIDSQPQAPEEFNTIITDENTDFDSLELFSPDFIQDSNFLIDEPNGDPLNFFLF